VAAASGDRPIQNVLGNPNDFNDHYRPPSVKTLILRIGSAASIVNGVAYLVRHQRANESIFLYAFDLIEVNGDDLR
jgi:hypothetical protein